MTLTFSDDDGMIWSSWFTYVAERQPDGTWRIPNHPYVDGKVLDRNATITAMTLLELEQEFPLPIKRPANITAAISSFREELGI